MPQRKSSRLMPDPFETLRTPLTPVAPDAAFAAQLRARLVRALSTTRGGTAVTDTTATMTSLQSADASPGSDAAQAARRDSEAAQAAAAGAEAAHAERAPRQGDIAYVSLWVPDAERAAMFFSHVLGWQYADAAGGPARARQVTGLNVPHGILGGQPRSTLFLCFT